MPSHIDIRICDELKRNGLLRQRRILKSNGKSLASMSLSGVFCTLAVAVPVFRIKCQSSERIGSDLASPFMLSQKLHNLINKTYRPLSCTLTGTSLLVGGGRKWGILLRGSMKQSSGIYP